LLVHKGGWMKREVEVVRDADEDTDGDADACVARAWTPGSRVAWR
jgi:hypothetical protein